MNEKTKKENTEVKKVDSQLEKIIKENNFFRMELAKSKRTIDKLTKITEVQDQNLDSDVVFILQELEQLKTSIVNETNAQNIKGFVNMFEISIWEKLVTKFGFTSIEEMRNEGYNIVLQPNPKLRLIYEEKEDEPIDDIPEIPQEILEQAQQTQNTDNAS